jgi:hypothetical protein
MASFRNRAPFLPQGARPAAVALGLALAIAGYVGSQQLIGHLHRVPSCSAARTDCTAARPRQKGFVVSAVWPLAYDDPTVNDALLALRRTGATSVGFEVSAWQTNVRSTTVSLKHAPRPRALLQATRNAHKLGFDVIWMLDVQLEADPAHFRDQIGQGMNPTQAVRWFDSYTGFVSRYAELAEKGEVERLSVGSNLKELQVYSGQWEELLVAARERFRGALIYTADPDEAETIRFWPLVDFIGVRAMFPLTEKGKEDSPRAARAAWAKQLTRLEKLAADTNRALLITEVGYPALPSALARPTFYRTEEGRADPEAQRLAYAAALPAIWKSPRVAGVYFWRWDVHAPAHSYSPAGKPAERVVRSYYSGG